MLHSPREGLSSASVRCVGWEDENKIKKKEKRKQKTQATSPAPTPENRYVTFLTVTSEHPD